MARHSEISSRRKLLELGVPSTAWIPGGGTWSSRGAVNSPIREVGPGGQEGNGGSGTRKPNLSSHLPDSCRCLFILSESTQRVKARKPGGPMQSIWVSLIGAENRPERSRKRLWSEDKWRLFSIGRCGQLHGMSDVRGGEGREVGEYIGNVRFEVIKSPLFHYF